MHVRTLLQGLFVAGSLALSGCAGEESSPVAAGPFRAPTVATTGGTFRTPRDAAPSPDGATIYFVADGGARGPGLFRVAARGGDAAEVFTGAPFASPRGLALSTDGQRVVVVDRTAGAGGGLYIVPAAGGAPTLLAGTEGTAPRGAEVVAQNGADIVYFTGTREGTPGVFRVALAGGALQVVAMGGTLRNPSGVAVAASGTVYVSDRTDDATGVGAVYRVEGGAVSPLVNNVRLGDPAGITLAPGDGVLGVSSHDAQGRCQVLLVNVATGATSTFNDVISANRAAGGVHRAHGGSATDLAWADLGGGLRGTVYRIEFR